MIYVTSDIHGEYDLFIKLLDKIKFNHEEDAIYILGDVVDRGNGSIKTLQYIEQNKDKMILIKGNHEQMMIDAMIHNYQSLWLSNGGRTTLKEYNELSITEQNKVIDYIKSLPCLLQLEVNGKNYILSHAGVEADNNGKIVQYQDEEFMLWAREEFLHDTNIVNDVIVIVGHTPTINIHKKDTIWYSDCGKKICIDCGAVFGYKLGCLRLDDMKEFYVK